MCVLVEKGVYTRVGVSHRPDDDVGSLGTRAAPGCGAPEMEAENQASVIYKSRK